MGTRYGGRAKGTPNRRTAEVAERLARLGCDPVEALARIAMDETNTVEIRLRALAELLPFAEAKRKSIDFRVEGAQGVQVSVVSYTDVLREISASSEPVAQLGNVVSLPSRP